MITIFMNCLKKIIMTSSKILNVSYTEFFSYYSEVSEQLQISFTCSEISGKMSEQLKMCLLYSVISKELQLF